MTATDRLPITPRSDVWHCAVLKEWAHWSDDRTVTPADPEQPGGLPTDWRIVSRAPMRWTTRTLDLVTRSGGGWMIVSRDSRLGLTGLPRTHQSLLALYQRLDRDFNGPLHKTTPWLRDVLVSLYDETDPDEAAARMLAALGGALFIEPAASLPPAGHLARP